MLFNSLSYAVFLPLVCLAYYAVPHRARWAVLLVFSYYFYMSWNPELVVLILFTTAVSWAAGLAVHRLAGRPGLKKAVLVTGIGLCLATLFFFKYFNFVSESVTAVLRAVGLPLTAPVLKLVLPVGISFYTFQTLSYIVDVYRGQLAPERHFGYYALYVSFFPQLVAGPIERAGNLLPQFRQKHRFSTAQCSEGLRKIGVGLFKKVVVADYVATFVNNCYNDLHYGEMGGLTLIFATLLFTVQIYCDFSGYSDIAVGSARLLGFELMENFKSPYFARSVREFWRRWHISLTTWFTDYVYIPLGGSRCSRAKHLCNLLITFCLSGLWHGAKWTFVLWGLYHGILLCVESFYVRKLDDVQNRLTGTWKGALLNVVRTGVTFALASFGWIFFRANNLQDLIYILKNLTRGLNPLLLPHYAAALTMKQYQFVLCLLLLLLVAVYEWIAYYKGDPLQLMKKLPFPVRFFLYWACGCLILVALMTRPIGATADFIYFQF